MKRPLVLAAIAAVVGWAGLGLGFAFDPRRTLFAYLAAFGFYLTTAVGALTMAMAARSVRARWFVALLRLAEAPAATLPIFVLLVVPILVGVGALYPWAGSLDGFPAEERLLIARKAAWLSVPFFDVRLVGYLLAFSGLAAVLVRGSRAQDRAADPAAAAAIARRLRVLSAAGLPAIGLLITWASFDLWMSLQPTFVSTVFGIYVGTGGFVAALALIAVLSATLRARGRLPPEVAASHHHALGKLLLSFVIFWAYIAFVQLLIIWIGDVPREIGFFLRRTEGSWAAMTWALVLAQFAVPFAALLSRNLKRRPRRLAWIAGLVLVGHFLDFEWLVLPVHDRAGVAPHLADLAALLAQGGVLVAGGLLAFRGRATVPAADPDLPASLEYETR
jgi:hypothetical protein